MTEIGCNRIPDLRTIGVEWVNYIILFPQPDLHISFIFTYLKYPLLVYITATPHHSMFVLLISFNNEYRNYVNAEPYRLFRLSHHEFSESTVTLQIAPPSGHHWRRALSAWWSYLRNPRDRGDAKWIHEGSGSDENKESLQLTDRTWKQFWSVRPCMDYETIKECEREKHVRQGRLTKGVNDSRNRMWPKTYRCSPDDDYICNGCHCGKL